MPPMPIKVDARQPRSNGRRSATSAAQPGRHRGSCANRDFEFDARLSEFKARQRPPQIRPAPGVRSLAHLSWECAACHHALPSSQHRALEITPAAASAVDPAEAKDPLQHRPLIPPAALRNQHSVYVPVPPPVPHRITTRPAHAILGVLLETPCAHIHTKHSLAIKRRSRCPYCQLDPNKPRAAAMPPGLCTGAQAQGMMPCARLCVPCALGARTATPCHAHLALSNITIPVPGPIGEKQFHNGKYSRRHDQPLSAQPNTSQ